MNCAHGGDELSEWAEERGDTFFLPADSAVIACSRQSQSLGKWPELMIGQPLPRFCSWPIYWLVAHALAHRICCRHPRDPPPRPSGRSKSQTPASASTSAASDRYEMLRQEKAAGTTSRKSRGHSHPERGGQRDSWRTHSPAGTIRAITHRRLEFQAQDATGSNAI